MTCYPLRKRPAESPRVWNCAFDFLRLNETGARKQLQGEEHVRPPSASNPAASAWGSVPAQEAQHTPRPPVAAASGRSEGTRWAPAWRREAVAQGHRVVELRLLEVKVNPSYQPRETCSDWGKYTPQHCPPSRRTQTDRHRLIVN